MLLVLQQLFVLSFKKIDMDLIASRTADNVLRRASENDLSSIPRAVSAARTTVVERCIIMATMVALPLEDHFPTIGNFSLLFIMFGVMAGYVLLHRGRILHRIWLHPTFLPGYVVILLCLMIESAHPYSSYGHLIQFGLMLAGGVFFTVLCRDKAALRATMYGYIIGSLWLSGYLFLATYGVLRGATATNYNEASAARSAATDDLELEGNLNNMAFLAAQGGVVALALALGARSTLRRGLWLGVTTFCLLGATLPMSRGGIAIAAVSCAVIVFTQRTNRLRTSGMVLALGALLLTLIPGVVFQRMTVSDDGRAAVYTAAAETVSEYIMFGVGDGNYWNSWAVKNGFANRGGKPSGAHNIFFQITIVWGLPALIALLALIWQAYRNIPRRSGNDPLALFIPGIAVSLLLMMLFSHSFWDKWYSLGLGLLVGARYWIWPKGIIQEHQNLLPISAHIFR